MHVYSPVSSTDVVASSSDAPTADLAAECAGLRQNQASQPPLDGSGFAFVRSLFGGSAIRARPESALPAHAWPTRTPSESQMRAAV